MIQQKMPARKSCKGWTYFLTIACVGLPRRVPNGPGDGCWQRCNLPSSRAYSRDAILMSGSLMATSSSRPLPSRYKAAPPITSSKLTYPGAALTWK